MCQKRSYRTRRDDAKCREADGVCDPAVMKGGGEEQVARRRRAAETDTSLLRLNVKMCTEEGKTNRNYSAL